LKITALSNHKPGILNNYIRICIFIPVIIIMIKWTTISGYRARKVWRYQRGNQKP